MKKLLFLFIALVIYHGYLEIWGGRDFAQIGVAVEKYNYSSDLDELASDLSLIYSGANVNQSGLATAQMANRVYYRWTDKKGVLQHSERRPNVDNFETIRMGDLSIEIQESLYQEEINKALNK